MIPAMPSIAAITPPINFRASATPCSGAYSGLFYGWLLSVLASETLACPATSFLVDYAVEQINKKI